MAMSDPTGGAFARAMADEMLAAQEDLNRARTRALEFTSRHPLPPPTRRQRLKSRVYWWQRDLRSRLGHWVAPWFDED